MKQVIPINATKDGLAPAITSHYHKAGCRDFAPRTSDNEPARHIAILEIEMEEPRIIQIANLVPEDAAGFSNSQCGRVYRQYGISPTVDCGSGGNRETKVLVKPENFNGRKYRLNGNTAETITTCTAPGNSQGQYVLESTPRTCALRGRKGGAEEEKWRKRLEIGGDVANAITTVREDSMVLEPKILTPQRTELAKALRKQGVEKFSNRALVPRTDGISNTITTVEKDNLLYEPVGQIIGSMQANAMRGSLDGVSPCLTEAMGTGGGQIPMIVQRGHGFNKGGVFSETAPTVTSSAYQENNNVVENFRIRKLTEREVFRLMDVDDADIDKIQAAGISKSQQYKLAGNSICTGVLYHIFRKMFVETGNENQQLTLF